MSHFYEEFLGTQGNIKLLGTLLALLIILFFARDTFLVSNTDYLAQVEFDLAQSGYDLSQRKKQIIAERAESLSFLGPIVNLFVVPLVLVVLAGAVNGCVSLTKEREKTGITLQHILSIICMVAIPFLALDLVLLLAKNLGHPAAPEHQLLFGIHDITVISNLLQTAGLMHVVSKLNLLLLGFLIVLAVYLVKRINWFASLPVIIVVTFYLFYVFMPEGGM
ncbi:hypothetical protein [Alteromonas sp. BMJM2]|uniref:hypothetical protein n=1 Tax=Alteromonas sp. BMJM2 TaxID=2954241 RepID=UPI0022B45AC2|nr:hypothetical protein [Alteromonas sp. BMJM2]